MPRDVFIAHASQDRSAAKAICSYLEGHDRTCWIAPRDVTPGREYSEVIVEAVQSSRALLIVFSQFANQSPYVKREAELAASRRIPILPVRLEDVRMSPQLRFFVGAHHWFDAYPGALATHLGRLGRAVGELLSERMEPALPPRDERSHGGIPRRPRVRWPLWAATVVVALTAFVLVLAALSPRDSTPGGGALSIFVEKPEEGALLDRRDVAVRGRATDGITGVRVNGQAWAVEDNAFSGVVAVPADGPYTIEVRSPGARTVECQVVVDSKPPDLEITEPLEEASVVATPRVVVKGRVLDEHLDRVEIAGHPITVRSDGGFEESFEVPATGSLRIEVVATDEAGHAVTRVRTVSREASWPGLLAQARTALVGGRVGEAASLLDLASEAGAPAREIPAELAEAVATWRAEPALAVVAPEDGEAFATPVVRIRGSVTTGRPTDRVLVNGVEGRVGAGVIDVPVTLPAEGRQEVRIEVVDGETNRPRGRPVVRSVTYARPLTVLLKALDSSDAARRLAAVLAIRDLRLEEPEAIAALILRQADPDSDVASAALAALDGLDPPSHLAVRETIPAETAESDGKHMIAPARWAWRKQECSSASQVECWTPVEIPAMYSEGEKLVAPERALWHSTAGPGLEGAPEQPISIRGLEGLRAVCAWTPRFSAGRLPPWAEPGTPWCSTRVPERYEERQGRRVVADLAHLEWRMDFS